LIKGSGGGPEFVGVVGLQLFQLLTQPRKTKKTIEKSINNDKIRSYS
jgi:hypothetical protein